MTFGDDMRVGVYIDGFNAYHAIDGLKEPALKWLDYHGLSASLLKEGDSLQRVVFYTVLTPWGLDKRKRHENYIAALQATGVEVIQSVFTRPKKFCRPQNRYCKNYEEKQTDVAIATDVLSDCYEDRVDRILLVTADSDQIPLAKAVRGRFPEKVIVLVAPPGRLGQARDLGAHCSGVSELKAAQLRRFLLPPAIIAQKGKAMAMFPAEWGAYPQVEDQAA